MRSVLTMCFFFFQAEDGIRDLTVTGVQTCALPIFCSRLLGRERITRWTASDGIIFSVRLVQIKLAGFKSFVDPTSIHVPGQLVGVVGPNGCGKSNVIDAVRWVLGESRAAALRGDSMQDVIFNLPAHRTSLAPDSGPAGRRGNLARITDIRTELAAQLEKLQAQAAVATRYKEYHSELQLRQQLLWYARRRDAAAERERHALEMSKVGNELEAENAQLRHLESRVETARAAHYGAGDGLNAAQAALYAEIGRA